jgi:hypothetical protein
VHRSARAGGSDLRKEISYVWQLFLPRLPFMGDQFPGPVPLRTVWFNGFVGRFGWIDYGFAGWVTSAALWVAYAVVALALATLVRLRRLLRPRVVELVIYLIGVAGVLIAVGTRQYHAATTGQPGFIQEGYLLPLYGLLIALAARGLWTSVGRRPDERLCWTRGPAPLLGGAAQGGALLPLTTHPGDGPDPDPLMPQNALLRVCAWIAPAETPGGRRPVRGRDANTCSGNTTGNNARASAVN